MSEAESNIVHPRRHAAVTFIFVTVLIDMLSFGIIIPVLPHLIVQLIGGSIAKAAVWQSAFGTLFMLMQFVCSPIQGALSDRFGRRTVILISSFGLGIDFIVMALTPVLWLLFLGRGVSGMCAASFSTANAYIADITPREKRAAAFGMLGAAFGIGFVIGPALGGFARATSACALPFWARGVPVADQFLLRLFRAAGIAAEGTAQRAHRLAPSQSARLAVAAAPLSTGVRAGGGVFPDRAGAVLAELDLRAVHGLPLRLGTVRRSATRCVWSACARRSCRPCWCAN